MKNTIRWLHFCEKDDQENLRPVTDLDIAAVKHPGLDAEWDCGHRSELTESIQGMIAPGFPVPCVTIQPSFFYGLGQITSQSFTGYGFAMKGFQGVNHILSLAECGKEWKHRTLDSFDFEPCWDAEACGKMAEATYSTRPFGGFARVTNEVPA